MNFSIAERDSLDLQISRTRALADVLQQATAKGGTEPDSVKHCVEMLYELATDIERNWKGAASR